MRTVIVLLFTALSLPVLAESPGNMPVRKHGLWEITMDTGGHHMTMKHCVGPGTDSVAHQAGQKMQRSKCSKNTVRRQGSKVIGESVCKFGGTTATTRMEFSGDFTTNYRGNLHTRYDPPMRGMREARQIMTARWTGPCKPGQRPGDVEMQMPGAGGRGGPGSFNMQDMLKRMQR